MKISYSAPAKVIFSGEHAVVYGKPALVSAINLRLKFSLTDSIVSQSKNRDELTKIVKLIARIVKDYLEKREIPFKNKNFDFKIDSEIPIKQRLGSSAALACASVAAFLKFYTGDNFAKEEVNNIAYQVEKYFHKNPSGVDTSVSTFGGFIYYRKEFEFLKNISSLNFKLPKKFNDNLFLIDSGTAVESTGEMVEMVGRLYNKKPDFIEQLLNDFEKTTKRMVIAIVKEDDDFFQKSIMDNQILLDILGVVSIKTRKLLERLEPFGVGKVTGAGGRKEGSGFLLFYARRRQELERYLKKEKINYYKFYQDFKGLKQSDI